MSSDAAANEEAASIPAEQALAELDALLARAERSKLDARACARLVELVEVVPGRLRALGLALADQRTAAAVDALLALPAQAPGVIEGCFQALRAGIRRVRRDGEPFPALVALDFRHSRARAFPDLLARAQAAFPGRLERLVVEGRSIYRIALAPHDVTAPEELATLHGRLSKLKGTRLWLNGWCFAQDGPMRGPAQVHLLRAWLEWASTAERGES